MLLEDDRLVVLMFQKTDMKSREAAPMNRLGLSPMLVEDYVLSCLWYAGLWGFALSSPAWEGLLVSSDTILINIG